MIRTSLFVASALLAGCTAGHADRASASTDPAPGAQSATTHDEGPAGEATSGEASTPTEATAPDEAAGRVPPPPPERVRPGPPIVVLMIGDGMGDGQLDTASLYRHGETGRLAMEQLPVRAVNRSASLSGITDSAASATTLATGVPTWNGAVGIGPSGESLETLLDVARSHDYATGVVTTSHVAHATPAAFVAHHPARFEYPQIARQLADDDASDLVFGGGQRYLGAPPPEPGEPTSVRDAVSDANAEALRDRGVELLYTREDLDGWDTAAHAHSYGLFADSHLTYVVDEPPASEPDLTTMSLRALEIFDDGATGGFLMIEGARIDHAGHDNELERSIGETLTFDDAIAAVRSWVDDHPNATLIVTADHETGGLDIVEPGSVGELSTVRWRTGNHSNDDTPLFATGPCATRLAGATTSHVSVHRTIRACLDAAPLPDPEERLRILDGHVDDLRTEALPADETFGPAFVDADANGFWFGVAADLREPPVAVLALLAVDRPGGPPQPAWATGDSPVGLVAQTAGVAELAGGRWDAYHVTPGSRLREYDPYADDTGARGRGGPRPLSWFANVASNAAGRGVPDATSGIEWLLPWGLLGNEGPPPGVRFRVALATLDADGAVASLRVAPSDDEWFVVDGDGVRVATSAADPL